MDPTLNSASDFQVAMTNLKHSFRLHRQKGKLPFGFYQHQAQYISNTPESNELRLRLLKEFIEWTLTEFDDVWYVTNHDMIKWMEDPVPLSEMVSRYPCVPAPVSPQNQDICDGIDNDGDGIIDNGLTNTCVFPGESTWESCFGCPTILPNTSNPTPDRVGNRQTLPPAEGCGDSVWDPVGALCVQVDRPDVQTRAEAGLPGATSESSAVIVVVSFLSLIWAIF